MNCHYKKDSYCSQVLASFNVDDWLMVTSPAGHLFDGLTWLLRSAQEWQVQSELNLGVNGYSTQVYAMDSVLLRARTLFEFFTGKGSNYCHARCLFGLTKQISKPDNFDVLNNELHKSSLHIQNRTETNQITGQDGSTQKDLNQMPPDIARIVLGLWKDFEKELQSTNSAHYDKAVKCREQAELDSIEVTNNIKARGTAYSSPKSLSITLTTLFSGTYNIYMNNEDFTQNSAELKNTLLLEAKRLSDIIDTFERSSDNHTAYYAYLKDPLINSGVLCDDILQGVHNDVVLLAMIGTRALLEDAINVHYLESKADETERMATAADWFRLSNHPKAYKNKLDDKSVAQRAKEAGKDTEALHDSEYADFCNYTHSTAQRSLLNTPSYRIVVANKAVVASLKAYTNIVTCVARILGEATPEKVTKAATRYLDKYRSSVTEATLPIIS